MKAGSSGAALASLSKELKQRCIPKQRVKPSERIREDGLRCLAYWPTKRRSSRRAITVVEAGSHCLPGSGSACSTSTCLPLASALSFQAFSSQTRNHYDLRLFRDRQKWSQDQPSKNHANPPPANVFDHSSISGSSHSSRPYSTSLCACHGLLGHSHCCDIISSKGHGWWERRTG